MAICAFQIGSVMKILHVSCSSRGQASESNRIAQRIVGFLLKRDPGAILINRMIGDGAISHIDGSYATALGLTQPSDAETSPTGSISVSDELIQELASADVVVVGTPMHNFTVPSSLKAWIDHVVRVRRTFNITPQGYVGALRDRPVFVAVSSGGEYPKEGGRQPDFFTPYLKAVLGTIGLHDVTFFHVERTAAGPVTVALSRARADEELQQHFSLYGVPAWQRIR